MSTSKPGGMTRWRQIPAVVEVEMVRWDGSDETERLIRALGGLPERCDCGRVLIIWDVAADGESCLDPGDWAAVDPDRGGVWRVTAAGHDAGYVPADFRPPDTGASTATAINALIERVKDAEAKLAGYENATTWGTSCTSCAGLLDKLSAVQECCERAREAGSAVVAISAVLGILDRPPSSGLAAVIRDDPLTRLSAAGEAGGETGTPGTSLIAAERARQVTEEGWTAEHDAEHADGDLAIAAACYAVPAGKRAVRSFAANVSAGRGSWYQDIPKAWPWHPGYWKPSPDDRIRELVKAGALIAAEIDRLQRGEGSR